LAIFNDICRSKSVSDRANIAPDWLRKLDYQAEVLADVHRWIHGDPAMEVFASSKTPTAVGSVLDRVLWSKLHAQYATVSGGQAIDESE
jgi:hypothetical protein